jgi:tetratricopeptide (TPR) repeat protein
MASTLAAGLASKNHLSVLFSFWTGDDRQRQVGALLDTLLWRLVTEMTEEQASQCLSRLQTRTSSVAEAVLAEIDKMLLHLDQSVFVLIDGLDECVDDWSSEAEGGLKLVRNWLRSHPKLHIILTGREAGIRQALKLFPSHLEISQDLIQNDLKCFIAAELDKSPTIQPQQLRDLVKATLEERAEVMFLWVALVFKELRLSSSPTLIQNSLANLPMELDREYHRLLVKLMAPLGGESYAPSAKSKKARAILSLIISATRPLTIEELQCAYHLQFRSSSGSEDGDHRISEEDVIGVCGDFICISHGQVHLSHSSIEAFLTRPKSQWQLHDGDIEFFRVDRTDAHREIGLTCIEALQTASGAERRTDQDSMEMKLADLGNILMAGILTDYASKFWGIHMLQSGPPTPIILAKVVDFLKSPAMYYWIDHAIDDIIQDFRYITAWSALAEVMVWCNNADGAEGTIMQNVQQAVAKAMEKQSSHLKIDDGDAVSAEDVVATSSSSSGAGLRSVVLAKDHNNGLSNLVKKMVLDSERASNFDNRLVLATQMTIAGFNAFLDSFRNFFFNAASAMMHIPAPVSILIGTMHCGGGDHEQALKEFNRTLKRVAGQGNTWEALLIAHIGGCHFHLGHYDEACSYMLQAEKIAESTRMPYYEALSSLCVSGSANALLELGKVDDADQLIKRHAAKTEELEFASRQPRFVPFEGEALRCANVQMNVAIAGVHSKRKEYNDAEVALRRNDAFINSRPFIPISVGCQNDIELADTLILQGKLGEAERLLRRARARAEKRWGEDSEEAIRLRQRLAAHFVNVQKLEEAKTEFAAIVQLMVSGKTKTCIHCAVESVNQLCFVHLKLGETSQAVSVRADVVPLFDKTFGESDWRSLSNLRELSNLQEGVSCLAGAEEALATFVSRSDPLYGSEPLGRKGLFDDLEHLYQLKVAQGKYSAAESDCRRRLEIAREIFGEHHLMLFLTYSQLAEVQHKQGKDSAAASGWITAGTGCATLPANDHHTVSSILYLATGHRVAGSWTLERVEEDLLRALSILANSRGGNHNFLICQCLNALGDTLLAANRPAEARPLWSSALRQLKKRLNEFEKPLSGAFGRIQTSHRWTKILIDTTEERLRLLSGGE